VPAIVFEDGHDPADTVELQKLEKLHITKRPMLARGGLGRSIRGGILTRTGAVAALVLVVVIAGAVYLVAGRHPGSPNAAPPTTTVATAPRHVRNHPAARAHSPLAPANVTAAEVSYVMPTGTYALKISADGPMWLGFERAPSLSGPWLATPTIGISNIDTYSFSTSGPLVVRIGAPDKLITVTLNGKSLVVPSGRKTPFDLAFEVGGQLSA
jgi:hypothetical protein